MKTSAYTSRKWPIPTVDNPGKSIEVCYNLKYVMHRKDGMSDNSNSLVFTTRKVGVWSKFYPAEDRTVWILVNPPESFESRLSSLLGNSNINDIAIHLLHLSYADD
ncbi:hypothetical protein BDD12DRAFT_829299, partial [Trichophaea hybrida]